MPEGQAAGRKIGGWRINVKRADELLEQMCNEHMTEYTPVIKPAKVSIRTVNAANSYLARLEQIRKGVV